MSPDEDRMPRFVEPILGVVFDLDGTLVASRHDFNRMRSTVIACAEKYGVPPGTLTPDQPIARLIEGARHALTELSAQDGTIYRMENEIHSDIDKIEMEALPRTVSRDGAARLLKALRQKGFRVGVLTRSSEQFCRAALVRTGLMEFFDYLRTRSSPGPAKPEPEALRLLLQDMGVPPERSLFVGDHLMDAECALRARVRFYGLLSEDPDVAGTTVAKFKAEGAAAVAKSLPELGEMLGVLPPAAPIARPA